MWRLNNILKNKKGLSLLEIVITTAVLSVGIIGIVNAFPQGIETTREQELIVIAGELAQAKLEQTASLSYAEITVGAIEDKVHVVTDTSSPLYKFTRTTTAELVDQNLASSLNDIGLKKVTVTVFWPSVFGNEKSQTVATLVSEK